MCVGGYLWNILIGSDRHSGAFSPAGGIKESQLRETSGMDRNQTDLFSPRLINTWLLLISSILWHPRNTQTLNKTYKCALDLRCVPRVPPVCLSKCRNRCAAPAAAQTTDVCWGGIGAKICPQCWISHTEVEPNVQTGLTASRHLSD